MKKCNYLHPFVIFLIVCQVKRLTIYKCKCVKEKDSGYSMSSMKKNCLSHKNYILSPQLVQRLILVMSHKMNLNTD